MKICVWDQTKNYINIKTLKSVNKPKSSKKAQKAQKSVVVYNNNMTSWMKIACLHFSIAINYTLHRPLTNRIMNTELTSFCVWKVFFRIVLCLLVRNVGRWFRNSKRRRQVSHLNWRLKKHFPNKWNLHIYSRIHSFCCCLCTLLFYIEKYILALWFQKHSHCFFHRKYN